ncbi:MAG TPA: DUF6443 domain-containing protein, partial [Chitinophagaceae bacterium]|nr:DUF6443 domain-containing protein [Chitinophagaceae bacterium]
MNVIKYWIYILCSVGASIVFQNKTHAQVTASQNYVIKNEIKKSGVTNVSQVSALTVNDKGQAVGYFDGLGRPLETVITQGSADKKDVINVIQFDNYGREIQKYLPYVDVAGTAYGSLRTNAYTAQANFYSPSNTIIPGVARDAKPYEQNYMEFSPLNRVLEKGMSGQTWQPGGGHTVKPVYSLNTVADNVKKWTIAATPGAIPASSNYNPGELYKNITYDENGKQTVEYKDKEGKVILKKVQLLNTVDAAYSGWLSTYYVYDDFNNLRCVIPPKVVEALQADWSFANKTILLDNLCFRYDYDARSRMITKKVPDAEIMEMVYDVRDRLVFSRDGNLRNSNKWLATFYDGENRPVMTALYTSAADTRETLQTKMNAVAGTSQTINYAVPLSADIVATNYDGRPAYQATNSITFDDGFDTGTGEVVAEITPGGNAGIVTVTATNPLPNISTADLYALTYTFYDDYSFTGAHSAKTDDFGKLPTITNGEPVSKGSVMTQGLVTGTKVRVLGTDQWLTTTNYYDDKNRTVQVLSDNINGGVDITTNLYDFSGKLLSSYQHQRNPHSTTTAETAILTVMEYDHASRLLKITKKINNESTARTIVQNTYNTIGQLYTKTFGDNLETLKYDYNIRGWLQGMNRDYLKDAATNYFGFELAYDQPASVITGATYANAQFNGNIAGTIWRSMGDGAKRKYDFTYDNTNRLLKANFTQNTNNVWNTSAGFDFTMWMGDGINPQTAYDANGNIIGMTQRGRKTSSSDYIDKLTYKYLDNSNKLEGVKDDVSDPLSTLGDFKEVAGTGTDDYTYDLNGNLKTDKNKNINDLITYNHLNLPEKINITGKGYIEFVYDAVGNKLRKKVTDNTGSQSKIKTTDYIDGWVYENDVLQLMNHEEGRIRPIIKAGDDPIYAIDYFVKDHLGNVRAVLTDHPDASLYVATMETEKAPTETALFSNVDETRAKKPVGYPQDQATQKNEFISKLNAKDGGKKIGPSLVIRVMAGDTVQIGAKAFYKSTGPQNNKPATPEDMVASLFQALGGA